MPFRYIMQNTLHIGKDGNLPAIGYGTYQMTNEEVETYLFEAFRMGYRHVDTAESYNNELGVGRAIQRTMSELGLKREEIFVTTKLWPGNMHWGQPEKDFESTITSFQTSLSNLGLEYIDLYLLHTAFPTKARLEQWRALTELRNRGIVKFIGVSNFSQQHIEEISSMKLPLPDANQIELHPWSQKTSLLEFMDSNSIVPIAYSSLLPLPSWRAAAPPDVMRIKSSFTLGHKKHHCLNSWILTGSSRLHTQASSHYLRGVRPRHPMSWEIHRMLENLQRCLTAMTLMFSSFANSQKSTM